MKSNTQPTLHLRKLTESATGSAQGTLDSRKLRLGIEDAAVADFGDAAETVEHVDGAVGREAGPFVEAAGAAVVAQHPQRKRQVPGAGGPGQDPLHERAPGAGRPPGRTDVQR